MKLLHLSNNLAAKVDDEDFEKLEKYKWSVTSQPGNTQYAVREQDGKMIYMHRWLLSAKPGELVDHKDGDGLNNQRTNIRICTKQDNQRNRAGVVGFRKIKNRFYPYITVNGTQISLGGYATEAEARDVRRHAANQYFGDFATDR